jgi:hypothetical protein
MLGAIAYRLTLTVVLLWWGQVEPFRSLPEGHAYYQNVGRLDSRLADLCVKWDGYWYLDIVKVGYREVPGAASNTAFLPAYPYLVKAVARFGLSPPVAGVVVSSACFLAVLWFAHAYGRSFYGPKVAAYLVMFLCVFPSSWVFQMVYTESLFCAAVFGFLVYYHRGRYVRAGLLAFVLPLCRGVGLSVLPAILADLAFTWWREGRLPRKKLYALAGILAGVLCVCGVYWRVSGHPFGFLIQSRFWTTQAGVQNATIPLVSSVLTNLDNLETQAYLPFLAAYILGVVLLLVRRRDVSTFFAVACAIMLFGVSYGAQLRYLLPLLPVHALIVHFLVKRRWITYVLPALALVQLVITRLFLDWRIPI